MAGQSNELIDVEVGGIVVNIIAWLFFKAVGCIHQIHLKTKNYPDTIKNKICSILETINTSY